MLMDLNDFWSLINQSRQDLNLKQAEGNFDSQVASLTQLLSKLSTQDIGAFENRFRTLVREAYRWDLWAAAYIIEGGCSDDGFTDFRCWLISMGQDSYDNAMNDVESLAEIAFTPGVEANSFEDFGYVAWSLLEQMNISEEEAGIQAFPRIESPAGQAWTAEDLPVHFPKLVAAEAQFRLSRQKS